MYESEFELEAELEDLISSLSISDLESEAEWEAEGEARVLAGRCTPTGTRVGSLTCSDTEHASVENLLQMSILPASLRAAVETSAGAVISLINTAAATLDGPRRTAASRAAFCAAFGVTPEFVPAWRSSLKGVVRWRDLGELVAIRLRDAAKIIDGGCIRYFCRGSAAHCRSAPAHLQHISPAAAFVDNTPSASEMGSGRRGKRATPSLPI